MKDLLYHHVKIKEGEPGYKEGEILYHHVRIEEQPKKEDKPNASKCQRIQAEAMQARNATKKHGTANEYSHS